MTKGRKTTYGHTFTSREQLISTIESYIDYYNRRYQHRLFIQMSMQAHVGAMNRAAQKIRRLLVETANKNLILFFST